MSVEGEGRASGLMDVKGDKWAGGIGVDVEG